MLPGKFPLAITSQLVNYLWWPYSNASSPWVQSLSENDVDVMTIMIRGGNMSPLVTKYIEGVHIAQTVSRVKLNEVTAPAGCSFQCLIGKMFLWRSYQGLPMPMSSRFTNREHPRVTSYQLLVRHSSCSPSKNIHWLRPSLLFSLTN